LQNKGYKIEEQMKSLLVFKYFFILAVLLIQPDVLFSQTEKQELRLAGKALKRIQDDNDLFRCWQYMGRMYVDSVAVETSGEKLSVFLSPNVSMVPVREAWIASLKYVIKDRIGRRFRDYEIHFFCKEKPLESSVPVFYNERLPLDSARLKDSGLRTPLVTRADESFYKSGLSNNNIALWASHGYYFESELDRWEWQRARLFGTVEDVYPFAFTRNFLVPMLEDAGAKVFLTRERDIQVHEVVVDNDGSSEGSDLIIKKGAGNWEQSTDNGFAMVDTLFKGDNPFQAGSYLQTTVSPESSARVIYVPQIPEDGEYAVYVSWAKVEGALDNVPYRVNHSGGSTRFFLNQQMGTSTWVYLGTFHFNKGKHETSGSVILEVPQQTSGVVSTDAVRIGGGMGNVARRPENSYVKRKWSLNDNATESSGIQRNDSVSYRYKLSGKPRWMEAGRYWMQYAGMPDSIVYSLNENKNDYNDDYQSRGEWVNYLIGAPDGPTKAPGTEGLNIPLDLAFAFHTDAGTTPEDSIIGTLGIYSTATNDGRFSDGKSRMACRDLTDIIQTQIVSDIRLAFNDEWTRRAMWDKQYSEAWRPNVPTMLLELLSHQNLADMKYGLHPRFQFTVARSVYKGMVRFLSAREGRQAVIKPLAPDHLWLEHLGGKNVRISWKPVNDPLESSAVPSGYKVYQRVEDNGFDNGVFVEDTSMVVELPEWETIYSVKVTALNDGGESFPGEILSVSLQPSADDLVLVVNGFDRVGPPAFVDGENAGVAWWEDEGVPWYRDMGHVGKQYDYDRSSPWLDDDSPGHGASYADMEGKVIPGNNFDFVFTHGKAIRDAGYSFISVSDEVFASDEFDPEPYLAVDLLYGEERGIESLFHSDEKQYRVFNPGTINTLRKYLLSGGNVLVSGAYIGSDAVENQDTTVVEFLKEFLHYRWMTKLADNVGALKLTDRASSMFSSSLNYNVEYDPDIYKVEAPDGIDPVGEDAFRIYRYQGNGVCAGVGYSGAFKSVALGFPFETISSVEEQGELMKQILAFFTKPK
jgi:N-acetylmuramoyl-L-alanine amidase